MSGHGRFGTLAAHFPRELGVVPSAVAGLIVGLLVIGLRSLLDGVFGLSYPYQSFFLGVGLGAIAGGLPGALAAAAGLSVLGRILFGSWFGAEPERQALIGHVLALAFVAGGIVLLRRSALQVRHERALVDDALRRLELERDHSRRFIDLTPHIAWTADPSGQITLLPKKMSTLTGAAPEKLVGAGWLALVHPDDIDRVKATWAECLVSGEPYHVEFRGMRADGAYVWMRSQAYADKDEHGRVLGWYGLSENIDARKEAESDRELLLREADHRTRNILTVLQGMVTLMPKDDPKAFASTFRARLEAMAGAHALLAESRWRGVQIRTLLEEELQPYGLERMHLVGDAWLIRPDRVQHLSMMFHELATNSAKYGCLSVRAGRLRVEWRIVDRRNVMIEWTESGGPPVAPPARQGFGTTLIKSIAERRSGESVMQDWRPEGLCCAIVLADLIADGDEDEPRPALQASG